MKTHSALTLPILDNYFLLNVFPGISCSLNTEHLKYRLSEKDNDLQNECSYSKQENSYTDKIYDYHLSDFLESCVGKLI